MSIRILAARVRGALALLALLALGVATAQAQNTPVTQGPVHEDQEAREQWFWSQRMYPGSERPYEAMVRARMSLGSRGFARASAASMPLLGGAWRPLGPTGLFDPGGGFFGSNRPDTLPFNGYADEVASLYAGMDLRAKY